jgi:hypothetical protein
MIALAVSRLAPKERFVLAALVQWIYDLSLSGTIRSSSWVFPTLECIHLYSMVFLIGLVGAFDMRLMGFSMEHQPLAGFSKLVLRWVWIPFGVNTITGTLLFISKAPDYSGNPAFLTKISLIFLGLVYHSVIFRKAGRWDDSVALSTGTKVLGGISLAIWIGVIAASRWIAYVS